MKTNNFIMLIIMLSTHHTPDKLVKTYEEMQEEAFRLQKRYAHHYNTRFKTFRFRARVKLDEILMIEAGVSRRLIS